MSGGTETEPGVYVSPTASGWYIVLPDGRAMLSRSSLRSATDSPITTQEDIIHALCCKITGVEP